MAVKQNKVGLGFWLLWVVLNAGGMYAGLVVGFLLLASIAAPFYFIFHIELGEPLPFLGFRIVPGVVTGILQRLVLNQRVSVAKWWILTNVAAWAGIFLIGFEGLSGSFESFGTFLSWIWIIALGGALTSTIQWLLLRRQVPRAGWWVLVSTVGWALSVTVTRAFQWGIRNSDASLGMTVIGAILGAITGGALVLLLREQVSKSS